MMSWDAEKNKRLFPYLFRTTGSNVVEKNTNHLILLASPRGFEPRLPP